MILSNKVEVVAPYKGNSKFGFWRNIRVGDQLEINLNFGQSVSGGSNGNYATAVWIINIRTGEGFHTTLTEGQNYLSKVTYRDIQ